MEDAEIHEFFAEKDGIADGAEHLASSLVLFSIEVVVSGLDVVVDVGAVDLNHLFIDFEILGVEEGVANVLELCGVFGAYLVTALHLRGDLGVEQSELVDASGHLVGGAFIEFLNGDGDVTDEGVDILDACLKVLNVLNLESSSEDTVNQLSHVRSRHSKRASHIYATITFLRAWLFITAFRVELGEGCCRN